MNISSSWLNTVTEKPSSWRREIQRCVQTILAPPVRRTELIRVDCFQPCRRPRKQSVPSISVYRIARRSAGISTDIYAADKLEMALQMYKKAQEGGIDRAAQNIRNVSAKLLGMKAKAEEGAGGPSS